MNDSDPLLKKADALMQRHRTVGGAVGSSDDVPVLTEIVSADLRAAIRATPGPTAPDPAQIEAMVRERLDRLLPLLRRQIASELDAWFDEQLPKIIVSLFDGFTDRLVGQISAQARGDLMTWLQTAGENLGDDPSEE